MSEDVAAEQLRRMRVTAGCRFIAAERLEGRDQRSALLIAVASSLVLMATLIPYVYHLSPQVSEGLTIISFFASLLIIAFSLIQYSTRDAARAEQFHRCGLDINELCRSLEIHLANIDSAALLVVADKYNSILQKYSINHEKADHDFYKVSRRDQYTLNRLERTRIHARRFALAAIPYALVFLIPAAFAALLWLEWPTRTDGPKIQEDRPSAAP